MWFESRNFGIPINLGYLKMEGDFEDFWGERDLEPLKNSTDQPNREIPEACELNRRMA